MTTSGAKILRRPIQRAGGLSLIELMVALALGLLVTAGLLQLFNSTKRTFNSNEALARVQENARFALETTKREFRESGTHGFCLGRLDITNHLADCGNALTTVYSEDQSVIGWEFTGTGTGDDYILADSFDPGDAAVGDWDSAVGGLPDMVADLVGGADVALAAGSDVVVIRRLEVLPELTADGSTGTGDSNMTLSGPHGLPPNSVVLVTDCTNGDLFVNTQTGSGFNRTGGPGCPAPTNGGLPDWETQHSDAVQAYEVVMTAYFIGLSQDADNEWVPGLYRLPLRANSAPEELVRGVENLQIEYGFADINGDGASVFAGSGQFLPADDIPNAEGWRQVVAMRFGISVRSSEIADGDPVVQTFPLAQVQVSGPGDGRFRQGFSTTVAIRNTLRVADN